MTEDDEATPAGNSTDSPKALDSEALVPVSSRKSSELTIEALYSVRTSRP